VVLLGVRVAATGTRRVVTTTVITPDRELVGVRNILEFHTTPPAATVAAYLADLPDAAALHHQRVVDAVRVVAARPAPAATVAAVAVAAQSGAALRSRFAGMLFGHERVPLGHLPVAFDVGGPQQATHARW
jgi:hypothetical protein